MRKTLPCFEVYYPKMVVTLQEGAFYQVSLSFKPHLFYLLPMKKYNDKS